MEIATDTMAVDDSPTVIKEEINTETKGVVSARYRAMILA